MLSTVCQWGPFADGLPGILPEYQTEVLLPRESSVYPKAPPLSLRMSSHLQVAPAQYEIETFAAVETIKGGDPAVVVTRTSSPPNITFTRSDRYLDTVPGRITKPGVGR
jgi:hypothetical protein